MMEQQMPDVGARDAALADALTAACTGGEEQPDMWRLTWLGSLLHDVEESGWADGQEDPSACHEAVRECRTLFYGLTDAMAERAGRQEQVRRDAPAADGSDIPF